MMVLFGPARPLVLAMALLALCLAGLAHGLPRELVVSHRVCVRGEGCHVMSQVTFRDSHVLLLTSASHERQLQGRLIDMGSECPPPSSGNAGGGGLARHNPRADRGWRYHRTIGLVRCGGCPLADKLREAELLGVSGIVIANTDECGRPTKEFLESTTSVAVPVAFVANEVVKEIQAMQQLAAPHARPSLPGHRSRRHSFIYMSIIDDHTAAESRVIARVLASAHLLLAAVALTALVVYTLIACSIGSLRYTPRELAPGLFGPRRESIGKDVLARLPLVPVAWSTAGRCRDDVDKESRLETPEPTPAPAVEALQQQLADIIVRSGCGSYSFTEETQCAICLDGYVHNESLRLLPCRHAFHRECVDAWLLSDNTTAHCPVCKSDITDGLRLLDKHGYGEALGLRCMGGDTARSRLALPLYYYRVICNGVAGLWSRSE